MSKQTLPFGEWPSPLSADAIARGGRRLAQPLCHQGAIYWLEGLPEEGGRTVLRRWRSGQIETLTPEGYSLRSRAQEYGGGVWCPVDDEHRFFVADSDQGIHEQKGDALRAVVVAPGLCFADLQWDALRQRLIAVCEDQRDPDMEPTTSLVAVDINDGRLTTLLSGADFYYAPRLSPDGRRLAWVEWDHPDMPWDACRLMKAELDENGMPGNQQALPGPGREAVFQPEWASNDSLCFVSDRDSGWWNLYRWADGTVTALSDEMAEFGMPWWQFNMRSWGFTGRDELLAASTADGFWQLNRLDDRGLHCLDQSWSSISHLHTSDGMGVMLAGRPDHPMAVVRLDPNKGPVEVLASSAPAPENPALVSAPEAIAFPSSDGDTAHALYYPPTNPDFRAPEGERPPLLVKCHGGPTGATQTAYDPRIQFWTSRGFAVVDVNYRGSTGYGRAYRRRLYGNWGRMDVADCVAVVDWLADQGRADPGRCLISGSSAGGYTVLAALTFSDHFSAGASHYGIGDLAALDATTHKFESRYTENLVGRDKTIWTARSPIHHVDQLSAPVIFFQGDEDKVVPPEQAENMAGALREKGVPVSHVVFTGEGHGFRKAENVRQALEMELAFYGRVLAFTPADPAPNMDIENL